MKKKYILILLGFIFCYSAEARAECKQFFAAGKAPITPYAEKKLCLKGYALAYSSKTLGNSYAAEYLTKEQVEQGKAIRRYGLFDSRDPVIRDYRNSGYDRGHMAPSGDMGDYEAQVGTFRSENLVPQTRSLNSGKWNWIESQMRQMAIQNGSLYIVTGPFFYGNVTTIGKGHVWVPHATWKAIYVPNLKQSGVYFCLNKQKPVCYVQTVAFFTQKTGIDPFPGLDTDIKNTQLSLPKLMKKTNKR